MSHVWIMIKAYVNGLVNNNCRRPAFFENPTLHIVPQHGYTFRRCVHIADGNMHRCTTFQASRACGWLGSLLFEEATDWQEDKSLWFLERRMLMPDAWTRGLSNFILSVRACSSTTLCNSALCGSTFSRAEWTSSLNYRRVRPITVPFLSAPMSCISKLYSQGRGLHGLTSEFVSETGFLSVTPRMMPKLTGREIAREGLIIAWLTSWHLCLLPCPPVWPSWLSGMLLPYPVVRPVLLQRLSKVQVCDTKSHLSRSLDSREGSWI
jgi:hypothetical protein